MHNAVFVGGTAGSGKSSVAEGIAQRFNWDYIEGDEYHPKANIDKMSRGEPLTDEDRHDWLIHLAEMAAEKQTDVVVSCSMLKKKYRDLLRKTIRDRASVVLVMLYDDYDTIYRRMAQRAGHYMKSNMLKSQFNDLELPGDQSDAHLINIHGMKPDEEIDEIVGICKQ